MVNRLLAEHIEMAGPGEAGVVVGSEILPVQVLRIDDIADVINRRIPRTAGIVALELRDGLDDVSIDIQAARPGVVLGHGGAEIDRLRAELEELLGKPVRVSLVNEGRPPRERKRIQVGPDLAAD
jgi:cell division ATPase FtsA